MPRIQKSRLPEIHIDIDSHNERPTAKRQANPAPRKGTAKPRRKSQITGKAPSKRLVRRRMSNTEPGYFPNPSDAVGREKILKEYRLCLSAASKEKDAASKAIVVNYGAGLLQAANLLGVFDDHETHTLREGLKKV